MSDDEGDDEQEHVDEGMRDWSFECIFLKMAEHWSHYNEHEFLFMLYHVYVTVLYLRS